MDFFNAKESTFLHVIPRHIKKLMSLEKPESKLRLVSFWRKDLVHINKARDNHFRWFGKYFEFNLFVIDKSSIGSHIYKNGTNVIIVNTCLPGFLRYVEFYFKSMIMAFNLYKHEKVDAILAPIGEEPIGWFFKKICMSKVYLIYDLWDVPGASLRNGLSIKELLRKIYQWQLRMILRNGDIIISGVLKDGLVKYSIPQDRIIQTENAVGADFLAALSDTNRSRSLKSDRLNILYIGYLHITRIGGDIFDAIQLLLDGGIDVKFTAIGPSASEDIRYLRTLVSNKDLDKAVSFQHPVPSEKIPAFLNDADVCLCTLLDIEQYRWSFPVKIYEYMAAGKVIVASRLPGIENIIINERNGFLYSSGNPNELAEILMLVAGNDHIVNDIGKVATETVKNKTWEATVESIANKITGMIIA